MPLWGVDDSDPAALPLYANTTLQVVGPSSQFHANTNIGAFVANVSTGVFGVDTSEMLSANGQGAAHAGWILGKRGEGGRAGRFQQEVLVATSGIVNDIARDANTYN